MTFVTYANTGPFVLNAAPGISATFLNNVESFLDQITNSMVADSHLSSDGNGLVTIGGTSKIKCNNLLDDVNGNLAMDLGAGTGEVKFPVQIDPNKAGAVTNGSVSGTLTFYTPIWGTALKIMMGVMNNYNSANVASFNFPTALTAGFFALGGVGSSVSMTFYKAGVAKAAAMITGFGGSSAGSDSGLITPTHGDSFGFIVASNGADQIQVSPTSSVAWNAPILLIGV